MDLKKDTNALMNLSYNGEYNTVLYDHLSLSEQCQHFQCGSHKGAVEAAIISDASLCAAELQACSDLRGQGECMTF